MKNVIARYFKRADVALNRIIIPKKAIDMVGRDFYLELYEDGSMILKPINKKEN